MLVLIWLLLLALAGSAMATWQQGPVKVGLQDPQRSGCPLPRAWQLTGRSPSPPRKRGSTSC